MSSDALLRALRNERIAQKRIFTKDWSLYDGQHVVFRPNQLSARELQFAVLRAYTEFYSFYKSMSLFLKLRFRNAMFRLMGYVIVKDWIKRNHKMPWLLQAAPSRAKV